MHPQRSVRNIPSVFRILRRTTGTSRLVKSFLIFQALAVLDLLGVLLFGYIGSVVLNGINPSLQIANFDFIPNFLNLESTTLQTRVMFLTLCAIGLLSLRSAASLYFTRRNLAFLGRRAAETSGALVRSVLEGRIGRSQNISTDLYTVTTGVQQLYTSVVGNLLGALADVLLSLTFIIGIMFVDLLTSFIVAISFASFAWILNVFLSKRVRKNGEAIGRLSRQSNQEVLETITLYREVRLRGVTTEFANKITDVRRSLSDVLVPNQIYGILNKYLVEGFLLLLLSSVAGVLFLVYDASTGFSKLAIFFIASSRIAPALMRLQNSFFQASSHIEQAYATLEAIDRISKVSNNDPTIKRGTTSSNSQITPPIIKIKDLKFRYKAESPESPVWELRIDNLEIPPGEVLAVTGSSGSGKTTLADLILGFKNPENGSITFDGISAYDVQNSHPGYFCYVPQDVYLTNNSLRENIVLLDKNLHDNDQIIWWVLELVELREWAKELPQGLDTVLGVGLLTPSGGQRQRLGLARGLISKPKVIVLDEVTSGLDSATEQNLLLRMKNIPWTNTQIWITHRNAVREMSTTELVVEKNGNTTIKRLDKGNLNRN